MIDIEPSDECRFSELRDKLLQQFKDGVRGQWACSNPHWYIHTNTFNGKPAWEYYCCDQCDGDYDTYETIESLIENHLTNDYGFNEKWYFFKDPDRFFIFINKGIISSHKKEHLD